MKKLSLILSLCLMCLSSATAQQALFDEANTLFENGELDEALSLYRQIEASGQASGALFLNMGITAIQLDSMGLAKFYFLKAQNFASTNDQAGAALDYVNSQFSRQSAKLPKLPWDKAIDWINQELTAEGLFTIGFLLSLNGLVLLYLGWLQKLSLSRFFPYILSLVIAGTVTAGLSFYADYVDLRYDQAVLVTESSRVVEMPNTEGILVSIAYEGYDLTVDHWKSEEKENWLYIRLGNGQFGWLPKDGVMIL